MSWKKGTLIAGIGIVSVLAVVVISSLVGSDDRDMESTGW